MMQTWFCASANGSMSVSLTGVCLVVILCVHIAYFTQHGLLSLPTVFYQLVPDLHYCLPGCFVVSLLKSACCCAGAAFLMSFFPLLKHIVESRTEGDFFLSAVLYFLLLNPHLHLSLLPMFLINGINCSPRACGSLQTFDFGSQH